VEGVMPTAKSIIKSKSDRKMVELLICRLIVTLYFQNNIFQQRRCGWVDLSREICTKVYKFTAYCYQTPYILSCEL
jgi:hypothetical protein